jgi:predicted small secreted protein
MKNHAAVLLAIALAATSFTGCGTDGGGKDPGGSGTVTFAIKDAPLASLQTLTVDITKATLHGVGGTANFQVFPQQGSAGSITVDLLSLQGMAQLLSSASVPAGRYNKLQLDYTNPQATDFSGNPQVITTPTGFFEGQFVPHLVVTPGSLQAVLIDVDLSNAYHDMGGNQAFLTPAIKLILLSGTTGAPLQRFGATVLATQPAQDRFSADAYTRPASGPPVALGTVQVQCDAATIFHDGQGSITVGGVTAQLLAGDQVEIEGTLASGVIQAGMVRLISRPGSSGSGWGSGIAGICGTIMDIDMVASAVTVRVQWTVSYSASPYTDLVVGIQTATVIHRGAALITLADLNRGNFCYVTVDPVSGDTLDFEEAPAYICGVVSSVTSTPSGDRVVFVPDTVSQIPVSQLPFVPSPLTVDLPAGSGAMAQPGFPFCVFAFFDGSATLVLGWSTGGYTGTPPSYPPQQFTLLSGTLLSGTQAAVTGAGTVFKLVAFDMATSGYRTFDVTVPATASATLYATGVSVLTSAQAMADAINQHAGVVEVMGSAPPSGYVFTADLALNVYAAQGGAGGNPGGTQMALGFVTGPASLQASGALTFTMQGDNPSMPDWVVTVPASAAISLFGQSLTPSQALPYLNASPRPFVAVQGTSSGTNFDGFASLEIYP